MELLAGVQGLIIAFVAGAIVGPAVFNVIKAALKRLVDKND